MPEFKYETIARFNVFSNTDKADNSQRPDFSNSRAKFDQTIEAGEYSVGVWKSEKGLSVKLEKRTEDVTPAQPDGGNIGNFDDF